MRQGGAEGVVPRELLSFAPGIPQEALIFMSISNFLLLPEHLYS